MRNAGNMSPHQWSGDWKILQRLLPYMLEFKSRVLGAMVFLILAKLINVVIPIVLKYIVDALDQPTAQLISVPISLLLAYGLLRFGTVLFGELRDAVFARVTERSMRRIALEVFQHLHNMDLDFHLSRRTGGLSRDIERGTNGISFLLRFMLFNILPTLLEIALVIGILLVNYPPWFGLTTLFAVVAYVIFSIKVTEWRTQFVRVTNTMDSQSNTRAIDSLLNFETVKYFTNESYEASEYDRNLADWENARLKNSMSLVALNTGQGLIIATATCIMLILAANAVAGKTMSLGDLVLINAYMIQLFIPLNFLGFVYREIKNSLANIENMLKLLQQKPQITDAPEAAALQVSAGAIRFEAVNFHYQANRPILTDISFTVPAGKKVAIVGPSGAGKSTLARLLFRFYDVQSGQISIDGQNIQHITQHSLRQAVGLVPQDTVLFNDTLYYNIHYGNPAADAAAVQQAVRMAHLEEFIAKLPDGLDTLVGERGLKLSGGEKQRVAIARTLLKNPPILVFDEATAALDSNSEKAILTALQEIGQNRTVLAIAHRLSTIIDADNIIVLADGKIVEQGNHQSLLKQQGLYAQLWQRQQHQQEE